MFLEVYVMANQNGFATGHYLAFFDTNHYGEDLAETVAILIFAPAGFLALGHAFHGVLKPTIEASQRRRAERLRRRQGFREKGHVRTLQNRAQ